MSSAALIKEISLANTKKGLITVSHVEEPYGEGSGNVVSVGINLAGNNDEPTWKVHIPYENLDAVIEGMIEAKEKYSK